MPSHEESQKNLPQPEGLQLYTTLLNSLRDFTYIFDRQGRFLFINKPLLDLWGLTLEEAVGKNFFDLNYPPELAARLQRQIEEVFTTGKALSDETPYTSASGDGGYFEYIFSPMPGPDGTVEFVAGSTRDISARRQAEQALQKSEQQLRLIFQSVLDYAIFTTDPAGHVTTWNAGAERLFGWEEKEIIGRDGAILWTPEDRAAGAPAAELITAQTTGCSDDRRWHQRKDGGRFFASGTVNPMRDETGKLLGFTKVCRDVTRERQTAMELADARAKIAGAAEIERARLAEVVKRSPAFMTVLCGPEHVFEVVNDRYAQLLGHRDLLGKTVRQAIPEIADQGFYELLDNVYKTGEPFVGKNMHATLQRTPGGPPEDIFLDLVYQPLRDPDGSVYGIFAHGVDLTEMRQAIFALRASEERFRAMADSSPVLIWIAAVDKQFIWFNKPWFDFTGRTLEQEHGKGWTEGIHPDDLDKYLQIYVEAFDAHQPFKMDYRLRRYDGEYRWILDHGTPLYGEGGIFNGYIGSCIDITDRRRVEEERESLLVSERNARAEAERSSQMKDEFLATLSHELRTPLNAILGWSQVLRSGPQTEEDLSDGLATIERNARAQTQIIEDLLDMSRIISGKVRLDVRRLDLTSVIQAAIETTKPAADAKGVPLQSVLDPNAGPITGDPNRLQQVLWNLLSNAIKFTPRGGRVQVVLERVNSHVEVSVIDTGEGINPEFLPFVFDRFRQADASTTRKHGGLGLGLSIVKQLVELHGGSVRVKSAGPGQGTTFVVALPLTVVHAETETVVERRHPTTEAAVLDDVACARLDGIKVLVVDDEPDARELVKRVLEKCNAVVSAAGSVADALQLIQKEKPAVLISDIGMPGEDGYSFIRKVRALGGTLGDIPSVALTAYARAEDRMKVLRAGFQMHIAKPVEPTELITVVAMLAGLMK